MAAVNELGLRALKKRDLPVFRIIGRTLLFEAGNLFTLVRLTWLPLTLLFAAQFGMGQTLAFLAGSTSEDALRALPDARLFCYTSIALQTIALSVAAVRVHRLVLFDDRRANEFFAFPFGRTEAWYVVMVVLLVGVTIGLAMLLFLGVGAIADLTGGGPLVLDPRSLTAATAQPFLRSILLCLLGVIAFFAWVQLVMRLMLWAPAVVASDGLSLRQAWEATRGRPWAMFGLLFFTSQTLFIGGMIISTVMGKGPGGFMNVFEVVLERHGVALWGGFVNPDVAPFAVMLSPERLALELAVTFFMTTFFAALLSFAYIAVTEDNDAAAVQGGVEAAR